MLQTEIQLRVRYSETDRMGYAYYGNYAQYFEVARVEMLRSLGITYKTMEDEGILLPVLELNIKYIKPAYYDDLLTIKTKIPSLPTARIYFEYDTFNADGELLNKATTTLVFIKSKTGRPCSVPEDLLEKMKPFYI
ncbi:MAG: thioesterase family protein [Bacteroidota bacterium]